MNKEFWEIFLPCNIIIYGVRYDGKTGKAHIIYAYKMTETRRYKASFVRLTDGFWIQLNKRF